MNTVVNAKIQTNTGIFYKVVKLAKRHTTPAEPPKISADHYQTHQQSRSPGEQCQGLQLELFNCDNTKYELRLLTSECFYKFKVVNKTHESVFY